jgi:RNase H-like domain found in reverse transcriptase
MEKGGFHLRPAKCQWEERRLEFLGVIIENGHMRIDPAKREGISRWPRTLVDRMDIQRMMGTLQYHRQFIPGFSHIAQPIFATLKKGTPFIWTKEAEIALDTLIKKIESDPQLDQPNMEKPFELEIDTSNYATGAVLIQRDEKGRKVHVGYHSEALNEAERNYDVYDREFLALIRAFKFWRHFLEGMSHKIKVFTDHANLAKHWEAQKLSGKIT